MNTNHLDARALQSPGGPIDALTATIRDATEAAFRMRDRQDERTLRRQLLAMRERQRGEDIRRELAAQGVSSVEELAQVSKLRRQLADDAARFNLERARKKAGTEDALDADKVAGIGRADFDRDVAQALASGIGTEYEQPEAVPGGTGPVEPTAPRGGVLRNMLKYDGSGMAPMIENAAQRGREDRDMAMRRKGADIAATLSLAAGRDAKAAEKPAKPIQSSIKAEIEKRIADEAVRTGAAGIDVQTGKIVVKDEAAVERIRMKHYGKAGFHPDNFLPLGESNPMQIPLPSVEEQLAMQDEPAPAPEPVAAPAAAEPPGMIQRLRGLFGYDEAPPIDLSQARQPVAAPQQAQPRQRPPGATVSPQELADYAAKHGISVAAARANLAAAGYKVQ